MPSQSYQAGETSPLLSGASSINNGTIPEQGDGAIADHEDDEEETPIASEPTTLVLVKIMGSIWLGSFLSALDSTIVATLTAPISASFNSLSLLSWLASAYFIANAALQPLAGKLTDIFGRRAGLIFSNVFFGAGNLICALAKEEWVMIFGRVVAGAGGGGLTAISTFVASDLVPLRRRGVWQGIGNIMFGLGAAFGGVFGGWVNDTWGWRWAFWIQVPLTVVSGLLVFFTLKIPVKKTDESRFKRIDFMGAGTLVSTLVLLLLGLNSGGNTVPWVHPLPLTALPLSAVFFAAFIYIEAQVAVEPIIPVRLLLNRTVLSACLTNWFTTMAVFGLIFYGPIYFQVRGMSPTEAGIRLIPQSVGTGVSSIMCGMIMRALGKYYVLNVCIQFILMLSLALTSTLSLSTAAWPPFIYFFLTGVGYAGMLTVSLLALIASVDHKYQAVITSGSYAFRSTGSAIGITISSSVFQNILRSELWGRLGDKKDAADIIPRVRDSLDVIKTLPHGWKESVMQVYMDSLRAVFLTLLGISVLGALVSLFMREHKLHTNLARRDSS